MKLTFYDFLAWDESEQFKLKNFLIPTLCWVHQKKIEKKMLWNQFDTVEVDRRKSREREAGWSNKSWKRRLFEWEKKGLKQKKSKKYWNLIKTKSRMIRRMAFSHFSTTSQISDDSRIEKIDASRLRFLRFFIVIWSWIVCRRCWGRQKNNFILVFNQNNRFEASWSLLIEEIVKP